MELGVELYTSSQTRSLAFSMVEVHLYVLIYYSQWPVGVEINYLCPTKYMNLKEPLVLWGFVSFICSSMTLSMDKDIQ